MKKLSLCLGIFSFLYGTSVVLADNLNSIGQVPISIKAKVTAETCEVISESPGELEVDIGAVLLSDIKKATHALSISLEPDVPAIKFKCASGKSANFTLMDVGRLCNMKTVGGQWFKCDGQNQNVGMAAKFSYKPLNGNRTEFMGLGNMPSTVRNLYLEKSVGTITIPTVYVSKLESSEPAPGEIAATYLLTLWAV